MRLSDYLAQKGLSDADFAAKIGIDRSNVSRLRRTGQIPSPEVMRAIIKETGGRVTPNDFFEADQLSRSSAA